METRKRVSAILFAFAGLCLVAVMVICFMFPNDIKDEAITNSPTSLQIQYEQVDLQVMLEELNANALRAEEKYQNRYVEIKGKIRSFDSDGKYIAIVPCGASEWSFETVQCYLTDDAHKAFLLEKNVGDAVTIKGKVVTIGEVIGYGVKIAELSD
jgi:hypothetical protein